MLDSQIFQEVLLLVRQVVLYLYIICLFVVVFCLLGGHDHLPWIWYQLHSTLRMILNQNIYVYGSWIVISIVLFDISKNDPLLVPYIMKNIRARSKQLILKWDLDLYRIWWNKPHQNMFCNNLPYIYQDDKTAQWSLSSIVYISS